MGEGAFRKVHLRAAHLYNHVILGAFSFGNLVAGDVGKQGQQFVQLVVVVVGHIQQFAGAGLEFGYLRLGGFGFLFPAFLHELADGGRRLLLFCQKGVALGLEGFAVVVQDDDFVHDVPGVKVFNSESPDYKIRRLT